MRAWAVLWLAAGCSSTPGPLDEHTGEARQKYPTLEALYAGDQGIYRGCGPNGGVCHNSNELPDLHTVGSVLENLDRPCNQKRTAAAAVDDLCEPPGDKLAVAGHTIELAWVVADDEAPLPRRWRVGLRDAPGAVDPDEPLTVLRNGLPLWHLDRYATVARDPDAAKVLVLEARPVLATGDDPAKVLASALANAGVPSEPEAIRVGDPNRNGVFGAARGGRLIKPGDPAASYLLHRLTDPAAGPLMPRANCCGWSLAAVRAMWCWIDGLRRDGRNAMAPIDYDGCRPSPSVALAYPEPGPGCETAGRCPAAVELADDARFPSLYAGVLAARCAGDGCHDRGEVAGVDLSTEARAFATLSTKVVPGNAEASALYRRITPGLCTGTCKPMPLGRDPLPDDERALIRAWIEAGAPAE